MALLSTTITKKIALGNSVKLILGTWTGSQGDAAKTMEVPGARCWAYFWPNDTAGYSGEVPVQDAASSTSGWRTLTVYNQVDVTDGRFVILTIE